jgi:hypothetical protein
MSDLEGSLTTHPNTGRVIAPEGDGQLNGAQV